MRKLNKLATSVKTALLIGAVSSFSSFAADAPAQGASPQGINALSAAERVAVEKKKGDIEEIEEEEEEVERVVVTGSRLRRSEFSNASPIQVISGDLSRELGLFDAGEMLQSTNQASGVQIDNTFGGYVLDNGPGAATIGFRGLGADRTLVLINGRRMAPAGVGGAPTSPDLNLIPAVMIQRVENLLDGASTVYGSDAVAGVANVILKQDIEGFELQGSYSVPNGEGGEKTVLSAMWGESSDNGFITVGAEYSKSKAQSYAGNPFAKGCEQRYFEAEDGSIINRYSGIGPTKGGEDSCDIFPLTNRMQVPVLWGSVYYTPGSNNTGIPNFSETTTNYSWLPGAVLADYDGDGINDGYIVDGNGDGFRDVDFQDPMYAFQQSEYYKSGDYRSKNERISLVMNGEYNFQDEDDTKVYFDGLYAKRESPIFNPGAQLFQWVGASNPYNPCNANGVNGVNCLANAGVDFGALEVRPIINIRGDRDHHNVEVSQYRLVTGITADLSALESIGLNNWYYDAYLSYSASSGSLNTRGVSKEKLINSLDTSVINADGSVTCGNGSDGCVPVNLFSSNIFQTGGGTFTDAEANYLFVDRKTKTEVSQFIANAFVAGDIFTLPWNGEVVGAVFGAEYRRDEISSDPNDVARDGLLWGYFADKGADGSRNLKEAFTEFELPLVKGMQGIEELTLTASGRISKESFYDAATTYSLKGVYRPVEWLTIRGTKGTSYRAPNLRERFLNGTSGFNNISDPCVVPDDARDGGPNLGDPDVYNPGNDQRDAGVLSACVADGADPTKLGLGQDGTDKFTNSYSTEITKGGTTLLSEETSIAKTYGIIIEQPFSEDFDLTFSVTRFDIEITNSITEPTANYSIGQCYSADGNDAFCGRLSRDANGKISDVDATFINIGLETSKGYDYNLYYQQDFIVGDKNLGVTVDLQATKMTESVVDILGKVDDNLGEPDVPEWRATARLSLSYDDFRFNWQTRFIGGGEEDYLSKTGPGESGEFVAGTLACRGMYDDAGEPLKCRPVGYTDDYVVHNMSLTWTHDDYIINVGVRNVFNEAPPKVDPSGTWSNTNIPLGVGYDTYGRTPYINFKATF